MADPVHAGAHVCVHGPGSLLPSLWPLWGTGSALGAQRGARCWARMQHSPVHMGHSLGLYVPGWGKVLSPYGAQTLAYSGHGPQTI